LVKLIKIGAVIFVVILIAMVSIGIFAPKNTYISSTQVIKSPVNVVWRQLISVENYTSWQANLNKVLLNKGSQLWEGATVRFFMKDYETSIFHEEQVTNLESDKKLTLKRIGLNENPLLRDYQISYNLKPLLDGTTEITIEVSYRPASFVTRIYNQFLLKSSINNVCDKNLLALRDLIEDS